MGTENVIAHKDGCSGERHLHIVYRQEDDRYRLQLRCKCSASQRLGRYLYQGYQAAERAVATLPIEKLFTQKKGRTVPRPAGEPAIIEPPAVIAPDIPVGDAWVFWWRGLCAQQGYASRL